MELKRKEPKEGLEKFNAYKMPDGTSIMLEIDPVYDRNEISSEKFPF